MNDRPDNEKQPTPARSKLGLGIAIGIALGVALGSAMHNVGAGIAIGLAIGAGIGVVLDRQEKDKNRTKKS